MEKRKMTIVDVPTTAPVIDYVCGLRKVGPSKYSLVVGRLVAGLPELKVDEVAQSLDHASEELRMAYQKLMSEIP